jgi:hypothetical protein
MPDLLRYQVIAVLQYSFTPYAPGRLTLLGWRASLYLRHPRQLQNLGEKKS